MSVAVLIEFLPSCSSMLSNTVQVAKLLIGMHPLSTLSI